jgi:protoheme IX farnesyltransferase
MVASAPSVPDALRHRASASSNLAARVLDYVALTRPRVLSLVLLTGPAGFALGRGTWPEPIVFVSVLLAIALVGGGCGALNACYERHLDARMTRTAERPLPTGRLSPAQALWFGVITCALGVSLLAAFGSAWSAILGILTVAHYLLVYTMWLKPRTPHAVLVGGAAGAAAPIIADAAANGSIGAWSLVLFAIVLLWQPPHFWAIALYRKHEYAAAGFPMMPLVVGDKGTRRRMLAYALALIPVTLLPWLGGVAGIVYGATALAGGALFVRSIVQSIARASAEADRRVFRISIAYLGVLCLVLLAELVVSTALS